MRSKKKKIDNRSIRTDNGLKKSDIILKDHQIVPSYTLLSKQHGLLLYYNMGTGKTISALTLILNFPKLKVNIVCPKNITFIWDNELKRFPMLDNNNITFYNYENINNFFERDSLSNEILIMDEAHNIIPILKEKASKKLHLINSSYKTLILTGTPIYNALSDLIYLINISAGKTILPYNDTKFKTKYYYIIKTRSSVFGYFFPITKYILSLTQKIFLYAFTIGPSAMSLTYLLSNHHSNISYILDFINRYSNEIIKFGSKSLLYDWTEIGRYLAKEGLGIDMIINYNRIIMYFLSKPMVLTFFLSSIISIAYFITYLFNMTYKLEDYKTLDTPKFVNDINQYIVIYKNVDDNDYPTSTVHIKEVSYSNYQLIEWLKLTQGRFNNNTLKNLNIGSFDDIEYYTDKLDLKTYTEKGVIIGNLSDNYESFSPKFHQVLELAKGKRSVVYSSFEKNGILLFKEFLDSKSIEYLYLDSGLNNEDKNVILDIFKESNNKILLLHPKYTEGISIFGAQQIHILEPIPNLAKKKQVIARVIRFQSHLHLPIKQRHVDIYQWCCTVNSAIDKIKVSLFSIKTWLNYNPEVFYSEKFTVFDSDISPDSIILKHENDINIKILQIDKELYKSKTKINCCINFPSEEQQNDCKKPKCSYEK